MDNQRRKRIRQLVRRLNQTRRRQALQIDILCRDMVAAHREFADRINELVFTVEFYESLLAQTDRGGLLDVAAQAIARRVPGARLVIFLLAGDAFELHCLDDQSPIQPQPDGLEQFFTPEAVRRISRANWICSVEDMIDMGLNAPGQVLSRVSAAAVPLGRYSPGLGFLLLYRAAETPLRPVELQTLAHICPGLSRALAACRRHPPTTQPAS
ncbi:MAG TPA: hypothetical protein ENN87_12270 [Phycisphaerales bacterium]|nr:hypothetical protein [Phycisphaerales bacterium]